MVLAMMHATLDANIRSIASATEGYHGPATLRPQSPEEALTLSLDTVIN
jgi:hypothetical protein